MEIQKLSNGNTAVALEKGATTNSVALFLPGASGGVFGNKYDALSAACRDKGIDFLRVQSWDSVEELDTKNLALIHEDIDEAVSYLKERDYAQIFGIGKSLGATALLTRNHPDIVKLVLWAPAIGISDNENNLEKMTEVIFSQVKSLQEIVVDKGFLSSVNKPVRLIQGTADKAVLFEDSKKLADLLPQADLVKVEAMGHTAKTSEEEEKVIEATIEFLNN